MEKPLIGICFLILLSSCVASVNSAESPLTLKWQITLPTGYGHFHPCMGDVDGDGRQEIVIKYGDYVHVLSGDTGALEWKSPKDGVGGATILELADLNIDGIPEIVYCGRNFSVYARDGFGKLLWTSKRVSGEWWPGTPVVASDTNGDKYPELYVVTADTTQPYSACITKLDNHGNILANSEICYSPCWGGLSLADADFNGRFEVYLGDRASRGGPGGISNSYPDNPARGLSCYDADTLETIWVRPDLYHSTPAPVLIDVTGDGILEVIGNNILNNGACVVDAITGQDIYNWKGQPINNHAKGTVWDIDLDGHVELISAWGYSDYPRCTKDFTVLDLVTGNIDYRASEINNWITYPPTVGDINDDGYLEILVATSSEEGHGEVGQGMFYAYNYKYQIIQVINDFPYGEQLWEPYCVDCDSDGLNEVLIGNNKGKVWCYDTPAQRPDGAPKCWSAWYSPYRQGAYALDTTTTPPPAIPEFSPPLVDTDRDETTDVTDPDDDNDGVLDTGDAFPLDPTESVDTDGDGVGNNADMDDDNDGMPDTWETENELSPLDAADASLDPDGDGLSNLEEYQGDTNPNISDAEVFPFWILGAAAAVIIGIVVAVVAILWRRQQ